MRILGVDPGLSSAGFGVVEVESNRHIRAIDWISIDTPPHAPLEARLLELSRDVETYLDETKPDLAIVERIFFATNKRTAIDVAHGRGVILLVLAQRGIPIKEVTPLQMKMAITGDGSADKKQVQAMVQRILQLTEVPRPADAADALALALYGAQGGIIAPSAALRQPPRTQKHLEAPEERAQSS